jgi:hypothetical protein
MTVTAIPHYKELQLKHNLNEGPTLLPKPEVHRLLHPRKEAAWIIGLSVRSLDYLIANKQLLTVKIGGRVLIPHGELVRFAKGNHFGPISEVA